MCIWQLHVVDQLEHVETILLQCTPKKYLCAISIHIHFCGTSCKLASKACWQSWALHQFPPKPWPCALEHEERASAALVADASNSKAVR